MILISRQILKSRLSFIPPGRQARYETIIALDTFLRVLIYERRDLFQMEGEHLQTRLDRSDALPLHLLFPVRHLPIVIERCPEKDIRVCGGVLQRVQRPDTVIIRPGFLCQYRYDQVVESIHGDTMARFYRGLCIGYYTRERRARSSNASDDS